MENLLDIEDADVLFAILLFCISHKQGRIE